MPFDSYFWPMVVRAGNQNTATRQEYLEELICEVEDLMIGLPQVDNPTTHVIENGLYVRTMFAKAGDMVSGAEHKEGCLTIVQSGDISVLTKDGCCRMTAPLMFMSGAGTKRLGYCHTDVVFTTVHAINLTDLEQIEHKLFGFPLSEESA